MGFYIEMPKDQYGNTALPFCVMEGTVEKTSYGDDRLVIEAPKDVAERHVSVLLMHGIVPCEGPARMLTFEEHQNLVAEIRDRDPQAARSGTVELKNGSVLPTPAVVVTMEALKSLCREQPIAFYELVMLARNPAHRIWGNNDQLLRSRNLIESDGDVHDLTRDVILNAVEGDGFDLRIVSPVKPR